MRLLLICLTAFLSASFIVIDKEETEHQNVFIGKKLSETPYGNYVKEDLTGDNFIVIVKF